MNYKIQDWLDWYMYVNIFFFLIENNLIDDLKSTDWLKKESIKNKKIISILFYLSRIWILIDQKNTLKASDQFKIFLDSNGYNKLLITLGYKDLFENIAIPNNRIKHDYLSKWSFNVLQWKNISYISKLLKDKKNNTVLDLWSWNSSLLIILARMFPNIDFVWVEINKETCNKVKRYIKEKEIKNINIITWDILDLKNLFSNKKIDIVTASFVLHEFITSGELKKIISTISNNLNPKHIVLREFCPPDDISLLNWKNINEFYRTYSFIHTLSNQETMQIEQWNHLLKNNKFYLYKCVHNEKYDDKNSLYPLLHYKTNAK